MLGKSAWMVVVTPEGRPFGGVVGRATFTVSSVPMASRDTPPPRTSFCFVFFVVCFF